MRFALLAETSARVAGSSGRLAKIELLADRLAELTPDEIIPAVKMLSGELPRGRIGVGYATIHAISVPAAAEASLTVGEVDRALSEIAGTTGRGSKQRREQALRELLARATAVEQRFLRGVLVGELRQGALEGVMLDAIARAYRVAPGDVRRAAMLRGDVAAVAEAARREGAAALTEFRIELMRPLAPMLAQSAADVDEALARLSSPSLEYKLDGARVQVHRQGDEVRIFTRKLHDVTSRVPELVERARALPLSSAVLDGEAIALREDGRPHPFQTTMRRFGRRLDVERMRAELPLSLFCFDCLHLDGEDLIDRPAEERSRLLEERVPQAHRVQRLAAPTTSEGRAFLERALSAGHEGVIAKDATAPYLAGRREASWLKVKPVQTFDLVVLAVEWGSGRRRGMLSNIHLGARDPATGGFVMVGKTFKGMTDSILHWQTERFLQLEVGREGHIVFVRPEQVVEIAFDGVQQSPHYDGGIALRFARVKRYREDKAVAEADTIDALRALIR